ncbi:uncharacterized protein N7506_011039 [Penicillium brevicompactum]|uniref:uncharacterized protein n=1 Tax=Penicillium brevicompactum TaxID=5074 RepID=UPI00253FB463|nr:uncharacterized protein N7506_011039 [Penicillium brevicompactum]KAJ5321909.1 hypothetical protein N7506_011039 [Penicillium brevicompactum]
MGSIAEPQGIPSLTAFERIGPKGWVRYVFPFQLADEYDIPQVTDVISRGFDAVKQQFPEAACEAVPDSSSKQKGVLKLQSLEEDDIESVVIKDLRHPHDFPLTYQELKAKSFPVSAFDADILCRGPVWATPGDRIPISLIQANFIRGGLILTWNIFHMIGDGTSFYLWTKVFYLSPEALKTLKADASPDSATELSDQKWISTNDAVSALLWRTVMAVQSPLESLDGNPVSNFGISINARQRMTPRIHPHTSGCFLGWVSVKAPIREIISSFNLADLAILVRKAVLRADDKFGDDVVTLVDSLDDVNRLVPTAFLDVPGFNCVQSSWGGFDLHSLEWGQVLGNKIDAVRSPSVGLINGAQIILPVLPDGGMEVLMGVEETCLERLLNDPLLGKYAIAV